MSDWHANAVRQRDHVPARTSAVPRNENLHKTIRQQRQRELRLQAALQQVYASVERMRRDIVALRTRRGITIAERWTRLEDIVAAAHAEIDRTYRTVKDRPE